MADKEWREEEEDAAMAKNRFKLRTDHVSDPARNFQNIATSDGVDLATEPKGVVFGTTGVAC
jgi:hypothetical protein